MKEVVGAFICPSYKSVCGNEILCSNAISNPGTTLNPKPRPTVGVKTKVFASLFVKADS